MIGRKTSIPGNVTTGNWANNETARFWARLAKDEKNRKYWLRYAENVYRRSLKDERMPGIWPKFNARFDVGLNLYAALEEASRQVPKEFLTDLGDASIDLVDCYSISERLLDDKMVRRIEVIANNRRRKGKR